MKPRYLLVPLMVCAEFASAESVEVARAKELFELTQYSKSLDLLLPVSRKDKAELQLIGQDYFMLGDYKKATEVLEKAAALDPNDPTTLLWLARGYGRRAETASPFTAPGLATKARDLFEKVVAIDPQNREAAGDLVDYYLEAPGFLGGGQHKAEQLASKVAQHDPAESQYYRALIDEKRKEYDSAEQHLRRAAELAPREVGRFVALARYLAKRGRVKESDDAFEEAAKLAPNSPRLLFERANLFVEEKRNLDQARDLLQRYLKAPLKPEDPPRTDAQALLKKIGA